MRSAAERWSRVTITSVEPCVSNGNWPIKRSAGESVSIRAGIVVDGHDKIGATLVITHVGGSTSRAPLALQHNDEYIGAFTPPVPGQYAFCVRAWVDRYGSWQDAFVRRVEGGAPPEELRVELHDGAALLREFAVSAPNEARAQLMRWAKRLLQGEVEVALDDAVVQLAQTHDPQVGAVESAPIGVSVDPPLATFAAWYEFFPRSSGEVPGTHGTLDDAAARLEGIRDMGFDIVYLPPVHPIGTTARKGKDNHPDAKRGDPGSPWAIGNRSGGHCSVHRQLGGLAAFDRFVRRATELGLKVALDIAFQCSPDHPWVSEHPDWFRKRADGSIRHAENPPKKYQDVYPLDFECTDWHSLWKALRQVFEFWIDRGVHIFRVDNPHTKPHAFWEWCLQRLLKRNPDLIFLAEAFTRPKTMYLLAKLGFNNSYTYFTWRNSKEELQSYMMELTRSNVVEYFRPSFWPNTPDILHEYLAGGGRPAHVIRYILAATLSPVYGVYGPPFEHVNATQHAEREEYAHNEKYELRLWNWNDPDSLQPLFRRINRIRKDNVALQQLRSIHFLDTRNPLVLGYWKQSGTNLILCVISLDPFQPQDAEISLPLHEMGLSNGAAFQLHDLLADERSIWQGQTVSMHLDPHGSPARIYRVLRYLRTEADFDYYG